MRAQLQEATGGYSIVRHRYHHVPLGMWTGNCCHSKVTSYLRRLLHMFLTQTHKQTQREVIHHLNATYETAAQEQTKDAAQRRCGHTRTVVER
jgi:hypothetical protein